ncbi:hypothetical protein, partial [Legionella fallonii]|uniref:Uncharacterized protein n=1 Tax=Legionella fallonii LLAP-10 TaxID=1212491 RepID=A0A098G4D1_9GAMM
MKEQIVLAEEYTSKKEKLIEILAMWMQTIQKYKEEHNRKNETLIYAWTETFKAMMTHLKSERNKTDCFLILDNDGELQGIAFGVKLRRGNISDTIQGILKSSYHVLAMLTAPWNIVGRAFTPKSEEANQPFTDKYKKIGTRLIRLIANHAARKDVVQLVAEPTPMFDVDGFFRATLFAQSYVQIGLAYELSQSKFEEVNTLIVEEEPCTKVFGASSNAIVIEDYLPLFTDIDNTLSFNR